MYAPYRLGPAMPGETIVYGAQRPEPASAEVQAWIGALRARGIRRVCCLLEPRELQVYEYDLLRQYSDRAAFGRGNVCHAPIRDFELADLHTLTEMILPFLAASERAGLPVVVHCHAGLGRTGQVLAAWLVHARGLSVDAAILTVEQQGRRPREAVGTSASDLQRLKALLAACVPGIPY